MDMRFSNHAVLPHFSRGPRTPRFLKPGLNEPTQRHLGQPFTYDLTHDFVAARRTAGKEERRLPRIGSHFHSRTDRSCRRIYWSYRRLSYAFL